MLDFFVASLQQAALEPMGLLFALILGVLSAVSSTCCTLPALGLLVGYSGTQQKKNQRGAGVWILFFTVGIILSLMIIGAIAGFIGQTAQNSFGRYWKLFAGLVAILFGLATLEMLPFAVPTGSQRRMRESTKKLGTVAAGLLMGGGVAVCSLPCNPGIFIVLGAAVLQGKILWATLLLTLFAFGFSLPLAAILLGVSLGAASLLSKKADTVIRWLSGIIMMGAGFYLLLSM